MPNINVQLKNAGGDILYPQTDWNLVQNKPSFVSGNYVSNYCGQEEYRNIIQFQLSAGYSDAPLVFMCNHRTCHFIGALSFDNFETTTPGVRKFLYWSLSDVYDLLPDLFFYWDDTGTGKIALKCSRYDQVQVIYICNIWYHYINISPIWEPTPSSVEPDSYTHARHALTEYKDKWSASNSLITDALFTN